jgi:hypothetical protein
MSKHERQHNVSNIANTTIIHENPIREAKRARIENVNSSSTSNWSTLYVNTQIPEENIKRNDEQQPPVFSSCFLTDKLLMPDTKKSLIPQQEKLE